MLALDRCSTPAEQKPLMTEDWLLSCCNEIRSVDSYHFASVSINKTQCPAAMFGSCFRLRADELQYSIQIVPVQIGFMTLENWQRRPPRWLSRSVVVGHGAWAASSMYKSQVRAGMERLKR